MRILAIDPGKDGGWARCTDGAITVAFTFPLQAGEVDYRRLIGDFLAEPVDLAVIEKAGVMPHDGSRAAFSYGLHNGYLRSMFETRSISMRLVAPQEWKRLVLRGTDHDKDAAIAHVQRTYPKVNLLRTPKCKRAHDGMADAVCIAEWAWRTFALTA